MNRGLPVDAGGEPGFMLRNHRFDKPVESLCEGVTTISELFEHSCKKYLNKPLFGTRKFISKETEKSHDGRSFEKFQLGDYEWLSYAQAFETISNFASGLIQLGHKSEERVGIFADTQAQRQIAIKGCFRQNLAVVTMYASLGEEALCHSLNETDVTTVICGRKELKRLVDISGQLDTVKCVIWINEEDISNDITKY